MIRRPTPWHRVGLMAVTAMTLISTLTACATRSHDPKVITFWTPITDPITMKAWTAIINGFEKANPGYRVELLQKPVIGTGDATDLITAVRGHTGPDVYLVDRYTTAQYAGTGILENLQPYINKEKGLKNNYLSFAWNEASFKGQAYGIPNDTDSRGLYYNKTLLQQAGINPDVLDPSHGPPTIDQVLDLNKKLNKTKGANYTQVGLIPWHGQGFWATWTLENNAKFFNNDTCKLDVQGPNITKAFAEEASWGKLLDYNKTQAFIATYQPAGAPPSQTIFFSGKAAMDIDGNFNITPLKQYVPNLKYGVTYLPVQKKGDKPFNWSGGFAYVIPKYAANPDGGWKFIRYAGGPEGQELYDTLTFHLPTWKSLLTDPTVIKGQEFFASALKYSTSRPPLPVNAQLGTVLSNAETSVLTGTSPKSALASVNAQVAPNLKQYCPFTLPAGAASSE